MWTFREKWKIELFGLLVVLILVGCSARELRRPAPPQMPEWCLFLSGTLEDSERGRLAIGIGEVSGIKSPTMARTNADGQARTEIAKLFNSFGENLLKDYQQRLTVTAVPDAEDQISRATRAFTKMNVRAAAIEDRYVDHDNGVYYSKAVIAYDGFLRMITDNEELPVGLREFASQQADSLFAKLPTLLPKPTPKKNAL